MKTNLTYYRKIFSDVDKRDIVSIYLLSGPETFIMEEMANRITGSIVPDDVRAFNLTTAYGSEIDVDEFIAVASSFPFLSDYRVLILRELENLRGSWKRLIEYCSNPVPSSVVILLYHPYDEWRGTVRHPRDFGKLEAAVKRAGRVISFERLGEHDLTQWVVQHAKRAGLEMDRGAAECLIGSVGDNLFDLLNEITKLSLFVADHPVGESDIAAVVGSYRVGAVPDLIDGIEPGGEARTLRTLSQILRTGAERPAGITYQLIRHFLALLKNKAGCGGGGPWTRVARRKAEFFDTRGLLVWLENLRRAELFMKTSSFPEETLLVGAVAHSMKGRLMEFPVA
jgi:DNA polymerase III delta subunit